jgi:acrylyl-CoA reductase (NADPH)
MCPRVLREHAWNRLSEDLELEKLDSLTQVISLKEIPNAAEDILSGKVLGRIVVDLNL